MTLTTDLGHHFWNYGAFPRII